MSIRYSSPSLHKFFLVLTLLLNANMARPSFAFEETQRLFQGFHLTQESFRLKTGVLISRPKSFDLKVINILKANKIKTLDDYARWLKHNLKYQKDGAQDLWANPDETLTKRNGDCEDLSLFNMAVLRILGYEPRFLVLKNSQAAHAICVFETKGKLFWFDNTDLKQSPAKNITELTPYLFRNKNYSHLLEFMPKESRWQNLYAKSQSL